MSRRWTMVVRISEDVVGVRGWQAKDHLERAGLRPLWLGTTREWTVDRRRAADVVAALEHSGAAVRIEGEDITPEVIADRDEKTQATEPQMTLDLFGGEVA